MHLQDFEKHVSTQILQRGKRIYEDGGVLYVDESDEGLWSGEVEGTGVYSIEVVIGGDGEIKTLFCDCPYEEEVCKHNVAVLYAIRDEKKVVKKKAVKKPKKLTFSELLSSTTKAELQAFLADYGRTNKDFRSHFELHFAYKDERADIEQGYTDLIKNTIRQFSNRGYFDYRSTNALSQEMYTILLRSQEYIQAQNFKDGLAIAKAVLKQVITHVIPACDDSSGGLGVILANAIEIMGAAMNSDLCSRALKEGVFEFLVKELENSVYFDYGDFGYQLFNIYRKLAISLGKDQHFIPFAETFIRERARSDSYEKEFFVTQIIEFFQGTGQPKRADEVAGQHIEIAGIRQIVVKQAIGSGNFTLARTLVDEGIRIAEKKRYPGTVAQWKKVLLKIAELEGDLATVRQYTLYFAFDGGFHAEYYRKWKLTFNAEEWVNEYQQLIARITDGTNREAKKHQGKSWWSAEYNLLMVLGPIYHEEKQWDRLFERLAAYPDLHLLLQYMPYLAQDFGNEVTELLIGGLIRSAEKASARTHYKQLVSEMNKVVKAIPQSRNRLHETATMLKSKYPQRPAMIDELGKLK